MGMEIEDQPQTQGTNDEPDTFRFLLDLNVALGSYLHNEDRVMTLIGIHQAALNLKIHGSQNLFENYFAALDISDILRSSVILLHANLESCLRTLWLHYLKYKSKWSKIDVPFPGNEPTPRVKIGIQELQNFRGKTIDEIVLQAIEEHVAKSSFGNTDQVTRLLKDISVDPAPLREYLPELDELFRRRHRIAHFTDNVDFQFGNNIVTPIELNEITIWMRTCHSFVFDLLLIMNTDERSDREVYERICASGHLEPLDKRRARSLQVLDNWQTDL